MFPLIYSNPLRSSVHSSAIKVELFELFSSNWNDWNLTLDGLALIYGVFACTLIFGENKNESGDL